MEHDQSAIIIPKAGRDDFLQTLLLTHKEAWQLVAVEQPELAREIEQQANLLRVLLDKDMISSLEAARILIDTAVFAVAALTLAIQKANATLRHTQPPTTA